MFRAQVVEHFRLDGTSHSVELPSLRFHGLRALYTGVGHCESVYEPHCLAFFCEDAIRLRDDADSIFEAKREYNILSQMRQCPSEGYNHIFIKELAYFVSGRYEEYTQEEFATFEHSFLVRDPMSVALSLHRVSKAQGRMPFFTDTLGFREMYGMHQMAKKRNKNPVVISVEDVFCNPR